MILIKAITSFRPIPKQLKSISRLLNTQFSSLQDIKKSINEQLHHISNNVNPNQISEDFSHIANHYIQLEEQSFS
jgi:hypothetical protein